MSTRSYIGVCGAALATFGLAVGAGASLLGADWPNWRGPNHDGISDEKGFMTSWSRPPKRLWEYPVGSAFSSFAVVGTRAYTCGTQNKNQVLFCFGVDTGKVIWQKDIEKELRERQGGDGTRATPTVNDGRVYIFGALGRLLCVDAESGRDVWSVTFHNKPQWAYSGSVLIEGDMAVVSPGKGDGALVALDKRTGKPIWTCGKDPAGYATPYPFTFENRRYIAVFMAKTALIVDAKTGRQVCSIPWVTDWDGNASAPIYHDGHLFLSTGYDTGCALFKLAVEDDRLVAREMWKNKTLLTKFTSCVLRNGMLYGGHQRGLSCVDFMTGQERWSDRRLQNASVFIANDHLIVFSEEGRLLIAKASPDGFKPTGEAQLLSDRCWTIPTLSDGKLFVRNLEKAACFDLNPGS